MNEEGRRNESIHFSIIVAQNDLLQIKGVRILIGRSILGIDDIGDALISFPIVGSENNLSDPPHINI